MTKQLMIKPEKCIGCRTCEIVCSFGKMKAFNPKNSAVSVMAYEQAAVNIPVMCLQCEEPTCLKVCPMQAITRAEDGTVIINDDKCIVCKMCVNACPLGNITFSPVTRKVIKCDRCGGEPLCSQFCPAGAIIFEEPDKGLGRKQVIAEHFKDAFGEEEAK